MTVIETYTIGLNIDSKRVTKGLQSVDKQIKGLSGQVKVDGLKGVAGQAQDGTVGGGAGIAAATRLLNPFTAGIAGAGLAMKSVIGIAADIETAIVGVGKTTGISGENLDKLKKQILDLGTSTHVPVQELFEIAQTIGQLGISDPEKILKFTDVIQKLSVATDDFKGADAASKLKTVLDLTKESVGNVEKAASAIVSLGNNANASEGQVGTLALEISKSISSFESSSESVIALAGALAEVKAPPELARSTIQRTLSKMKIAFIENGEAAQKFAEIAGTSVAKLKEEFEVNALGALNKFTTGLQKQKDAGVSVVENLDELELRGSGFSMILGLLATQSERAVEIQKMVNDEYKNAIALNEEAQTAGKTLQASLGRLSNAFTSLGDSLGVVLIPALTDVVEGFTEIIKMFNKATGYFSKLFGGGDETEKAKKTEKTKSYDSSLIRREKELIEMIKKIKDSGGTDAALSRRNKELQAIQRMREQMQPEKPTAAAAQPSTTTTTTGDISITVPGTSDPTETAHRVFGVIQDELSGTQLAGT